MANRSGKSESSERFYFERAPKSQHVVVAVMKLKDTCPLEEKL